MLPALLAPRLVAVSPPALFLVTVPWPFTFLRLVILEALECPAEIAEAIGMLVDSMSSA